MGCGYEDDKAEFLINTFELKVVFPYVCIGKPYTCNVLRHYPILHKIALWVPACICVALLCM